MFNHFFFPEVSHGFGQRFAKLASVDFVSWSFETSFELASYGCWMFSGTSDEFTWFFGWLVVVFVYFLNAFGLTKKAFLVRRMFLSTPRKAAEMNGEDH